MLYALDRINADSSLLPDIKLGAILLDSCSSSTYALNQSLEFIRASINTVESSAFECKDKSSPRPKYGSKMIAGVVGGSYSEVSLQVANLLRLFRIPQVSDKDKLQLIAISSLFIHAQFKPQTVYSISNCLYFQFRPFAGTKFHQIPQTSINFNSFQLILTHFSRP